MVSDTQQLALDFAVKYIKDFYANGGTMYKLNQHYRSQMLGVACDDFDWQEHLNNAKSDFTAFDTLRRYCAHEIRKAKTLPDELRYWISDVLEGIEPTLSEPKGGVATGSTENTFLPNLVRKLADKFGLPPTRATEGDPISACDIVARAIKEIPEAREIRSREYETIRKLYARAGKNGAFD